MGLIKEADIDAKLQESLSRLLRDIFSMEEVEEKGRQDWVQLPASHWPCSRPHFRVRIPTAGQISDPENVDTFTVCATWKPASPFQSTITPLVEDDHEVISLFYTWLKAPKAPRPFTYDASAYSSQPWRSKAARAWLLATRLQHGDFERYSLAEFIQNCAVAALTPWSEIESFAGQSSSLGRFSRHWIAWDHAMSYGSGNRSEYDGLEAAGLSRSITEEAKLRDPRTFGLEHWFQTCGDSLEPTCSHDPLTCLRASQATATERRRRKLARIRVSPRVKYIERKRQWTTRDLGYHPISIASTPISPPPTPGPSFAPGLVAKGFKGWRAAVHEFMHWEQRRVRILTVRCYLIHHGSQLLNSRTNNKQWIYMALQTIHLVVSIPAVTGAYPGIVSTTANFNMFVVIVGLFTLPFPHIMPLYLLFTLCDAAATTSNCVSCRSVSALLSPDPP